MATPQITRRYVTTLDDETHAAAQGRMKALGLNDDDNRARSEFVRTAIAHYLGVPVPEVKPGRRWPNKTE